MKALVIDGLAVNVVAADQLASSFHPDVASKFVTVPAQVDVGWRLVGGVWTAPEVVEPPEPVLPAEAYVIDITTFKMRFTPMQIAEIRASEDQVVKVFLSEIVDDQRTTNVNLLLPFVQGAIDYLAQLGLIAEGDVVSILAPK